MGWLWWWITDWWCSKILYCLCSKMTSFQPSQGVDWNQLWFHLIKTFLVYYIFLGTCLDNFTSKFEGKPHTNCFASSSRNKLFFETCPDSLKECYLFIFYFMDVICVLKPFRSFKISSDTDLKCCLSFVNFDGVIFFRTLACTVQWGEGKINTYYHHSKSHLF